MKKTTVQVETQTSNGAFLVLVKLALDEAQHQAGLSHC